MKALIFLLLLVQTLRADDNTVVEHLTDAARNGDGKMVDTLLSFGISPNATDRFGKTALYYAAQFNQIEITQLLLAHLADPNVPIKQNEGRFPETPLQNASYMGNRRIVSLLLDAGAQVNAKSADGHTALQFAVEGVRLDTMQALIEKGADVNTRDAEGAAPLDYAVWNGTLNTVAILLANGARVNEPDSKTGATPINEAAYLGETQLVRYLLHFNPDLTTVDKHGYGPLENATRMGKDESAAVLLDGETKDANPPRFLAKLADIAIRKDEPLLVAALLQHGLKINEALPSGARPIEAASSAKAAKVAKVLLESGADPKVTGPDGSTPLEDAALAGFDSIVSMLLDHGAPIDQISGDSGTTALYAAASFGKANAVKLLLQRGANSALCGKNHKTAYQSAVENGFQEVAAEIQNHGGAKACQP